MAPISPLVPINHIAIDLPCPEDKDNGPIPRPPYDPEDISKVQRILMNFVPPEIAGIIVDMAEIWPYVGISRNTYTPALTALEGKDGNAQWCYLVSPPIPALVKEDGSLPTAVRKVEFHVKSYNSCWGGSNTEKGTQGKTWLEASILKASDAESYHCDIKPHNWFTNLCRGRPKLLNATFDPNDATNLEPKTNPFDNRRRWTVMDDITPDREWHDVSWTQAKSDFINDLSVGDRIVLMVRAVAPGWLTALFNVKLDIFYSLPFSHDA